jgi:hypothetical protein
VKPRSPCGLDTFLSCTGYSRGPESRLCKGQTEVLSVAPAFHHTADGRRPWQRAAHSRQQAALGIRRCRWCHPAVQGSWAAGVIACLGARLSAYAYYERMQCMMQHLGITICRWAMQRSSSGSTSVRWCYMRLCTICHDWRTRHTGECAQGRQSKPAPPVLVHVCRQLLVVDALVVSGTAIRYLPEKKLTQQMALAFWVFHYAKRILETFFVHRWDLHAPETCLALVQTESLLPIPCM